MWAWPWRKRGRAVFRSPSNACTLGLFFAPTLGMEDTQCPLPPFPPHREQAKGRRTSGTGQEVEGPNLTFDEPKVLTSPTRKAGKKSGFTSVELLFVVSTATTIAACVLL